jgi:site-specific recombinase XerD
MVLTEYDRVRVEGSLERWAPGFAAALAVQGFTYLTICYQLRLFAYVSRWLAARKLRPGHLTPARIEQVIRQRRREGYTNSLSARALAPLMEYLRAAGATPASRETKPQTYADRVVFRYREYLINERGLGASSLNQRCGFARAFLARHKHDASLAKIGAGEIRKYYRLKSQGFSVSYAKIVANSLRSLLRFLHVVDLIPASLIAAVPAVSGWRLQSLPKALPPDAIGKMLKSCDRTTLTGRRDFAVLNLMGRLGLRSCEVVRLQLEDIDWRQSEIVIRGKGKNLARLPLPQDVGCAISAYLIRRPSVTFRSVFLLKPAPIRPITTQSIASIVELASIRAGLPRTSPHKLRHTAATEVLRRGGSLEEVAELLRHKDLGTAAIYAKVDRGALRELVQPWPGGAL